MRKLNVTRMVPLEWLDFVPEQGDVVGDVKQELVTAITQDLGKYHGMQFGSRREDATMSIAFTLRTFAFDYDDQAAIQGFVKSGQDLLASGHTPDSQPAAWASIAQMLHRSLTDQRDFNLDSVKEGGE